MENILFIWDGEPNNYVTVCLESLRLHNKNCKIYFYYSNENIIREYKKFNIEFILIDKSICKNRFQYYKILISKNLCYKLNENEKLLVLDCDLLFQNDPFLLFSENENSDFYYTHSILSTKDSLREDNIWKGVDYRVNGGVWGLIVNNNSRKLMDFWVKNILDNSWEKWRNYKPHIDNGLNDLNWNVDQDFLNCIDNYELPFELNKNIVSYKFNYYTSVWGFFNNNLEMSSKIGNKDYVIIHFKGKFKKIYNINDKNIYNMKNILLKKQLYNFSGFSFMKNIYNSRLINGKYPHV